MRLWGPIHSGFFSPRVSIPRSFNFFSLSFCFLLFLFSLPSVLVYIFSWLLCWTMKDFCLTNLWRNSNPNSEHIPLVSSLHQRLVFMSHTTCSIKLLTEFKKTTQACSSVILATDALKKQRGSS